MEVSSDKRAELHLKPHLSEESAEAFEVAVEEILTKDEKILEKAMEDLKKILFALDPKLKAHSMPEIGSEVSVQIEKIFEDLFKKQAEKWELQNLNETERNAAGVAYVSKFKEILRTQITQQVQEFSEQVLGLVSQLKEALSFQDNIRTESEGNKTRINNSRLTIQISEDKLSAISTEAKRIKNKNPDKLDEFLKKNETKKVSLTGTITKHQAIIEKCEKREQELEQNILIAADLREESRELAGLGLENSKNTLYEKIRLAVENIHCSEDEISACHSKIYEETEKAKSASQEDISKAVNELSESYLKEHAQIAKDLSADRFIVIRNIREHCIRIPMSEYRDNIRRALGGESTDQIESLLKAAKLVNDGTYGFTPYYKLINQLITKIPDLTESETRSNLKLIGNNILKGYERILTSKKLGKRKLDIPALNLIAIYAASDIVFFRQIDTVSLVPPYIRQLRLDSLDLSGLFG